MKEKDDHLCFMLYVRKAGTAGVAIYLPKKFREFYGVCEGDAFKLLRYGRGEKHLIFVLELVKKASLEKDWLRASAFTCTNDAPARKNTGGTMCESLR